VTSVNCPILILGGPRDQLDPSPHSRHPLLRVRAVCVCDAGFDHQATVRALFGDRDSDDSARDRARAVALDSTSLAGPGDSAHAAAAADVFPRGARVLCVYHLLHRAQQHPAGRGGGGVHDRAAVRHPALGAGAARAGRPASLERGGHRLWRRGVHAGSGVVAVSHRVGDAAVQRAVLCADLHHQSPSSIATSVSPSTR